MSSWSPALRSASLLMLATRFPMTLFWGPEFILIYNEAYVPLIADKHPAALGAPAREVFSEAWPTIGPLMESVRATGEPTWHEDASVPLHRHGFLEEAYFTFSYSAVRDEHGVVEGVMDIAAETTQQVLDRRRLHLLSRLGEELSDLTRAADLPQRALRILRANREEFPAVDIRLGDGPGSGPPPGDGEVQVQETASGRVAWLPLSAPAAPVLVVRLSELLAADEAYLGFLRLVANALEQALRRAGLHAAERGMSEALQHSLLTQPIEPDHLQIAVRYLPAAEQAKLGGDWYDAFMLPSGSLAMVIGDVTGHDLEAAAAMAQARNLLRGISYTIDEPPARVLAALDRAMYGLAVNTYATAILAHVEQGEMAAEDGVRTLRWSNAGHPPPVLLAPDGSARLLEAHPDALLGLGAAERTDHTVTLDPGATLVFYTDGLVERRSASLDDQLARLLAALEGRDDMNAETLSDYLVSKLSGTAEDDVALLVLRTHSERGPRPAEAGPRVLPSDLREH